MADRLAWGVSILAVIDKRRRTSGNSSVGSNIERMVVDRELRELIEEVAEEPEPLITELDATMVRRRKR